MKKWAWIVVALYGLTLVVFTLPIFIILFGISITDTITKDLFTSWPYWLGIIILLVAQVILLVVPVCLAERRPVSQRLVILPIAASALMFGILAGSIFIATSETLSQTEFIKNPNPYWVAALILLIITWVTWGWLFYRKSRGIEAANRIEKMSRALFVGSILELLIAIPMHILARNRNYCCAGFGTFWGIAFGIAIMLFSFGPGIFFLFVERWKKLHPEKK